MSEPDDTAPSCPIPGAGADDARDVVVLGHGSGGTLTARLVRDVFLSVFDSATLAKLEDAATLDAPRGRIAMTTDAFVARPPFFPGGDLGRLAAAGTINDLAVSGARPRWLSAAFILEAGTPIDHVRRVAQSMAATCREAGVELVAGDTKVVEHGKGDGIFITTSGVGIVPDGRTLSIHSARSGDSLVVTGPIGDHGIAVMSVREGVAFETDLLSDVAPLASLTEAALEACPSIRCMRDPTRGGLAGALCDIAAASNVGIRLDEARIPLRDAVRAACDLLGLDPLHVACEGRFVAVVPHEDETRLVEALRAHPLGRDATVVGRVVDTHPGRVTLRSPFGGERWVTLLAGEQLPRIC